MEGPYHILKLLSLVDQQRQEVQDNVLPLVQTWAWFAHPEPLLLPLLASSNEEDRNFGFDQILKIRGDSDYGDKKPRARKTPTINMKANSLKDLIYWENEKIHEPIFTCSLSQFELKEILDSPMEVPYYPLHTQSTERAVKQVI